MCLPLAPYPLPPSLSPSWRDFSNFLGVIVCREKMPFCDNFRRILPVFVHSFPLCCTFSFHTRNRQRRGSLAHRRWMKGNGIPVDGGEQREEQTHQRQPSPAVPLALCQCAVHTHPGNTQRRGSLALWRRLEGNGIPINGGERCEEQIHLANLCPSDLGI